MRPDSGALHPTGLSRPNLGPHVLERPRLVQALAEHAHVPLVLLVADAGYGKTTLVASATRALKRPVVWYSLMASDADPVVFGRHLLAAFRRENPRFGRDFERSLNDLRPGVETGGILGTILANSIASLRGGLRILVLDDFHEVSANPAVQALVEALLRHQPERLGLWITSRTMPPLSLERLRSHGGVYELHSRHLCFTRDELERLFAEVFHRPLDDAALDALESTTQGWPTAVHLVHESLHRNAATSLDQVLDEVRASPLDMHAYLSAEVYNRLEPAFRKLLESTAALERFDGEIARDLSGLRDARARLEALAQRGLLRSFGAAGSGSYECHDLVRRFVRREIESQPGDAWRGIESATADALSVRGELERALPHLVASDRIEEAAATLCDLAPRLLSEGRAARLIEFLATLPAGRVERDLTLLRSRADAHQSLGDWDQAAADYERVLEAARAAGARAEECRALLGFGKVLNLRGRYEQVLGMAERGLAAARTLDVELQVKLLQMKAAAHFYLGQYQAAVRILDEVRTLLGPAPAPALLVPTVHNLAIAYAAQGEYRKASSEFRAALAHVRGTASPRAALYLSNLASLLSELGELADARRAAEEGLEAAQRFSNRAHETKCLEALADVLARSGDLDGALASLRRAEEIHSDLRMEVLTADLLALRGRIHCARGQYRRAAELITRAIEHQEERPGSPRLIDFKSTLAWCELRAGRAHVAAGQLQAIAPLADAGENHDQRMRVHYWLGEALLASGDELGALAHLRQALALVRERGYLPFLRVQAREQPAPVLAALAHGIEIDTCAGALAEAGAAVEGPLLDLATDAPVPVAEAALAVLAEIGGGDSAARLPAIAAARRALEPAVRNALEHANARRQHGRNAESGTPRAARLVLFGPPRLEIEGATLPASSWRTQRAFHVMVYLAFHPRGAGRDALIDSFWPGRQAAAGRRNFHPTLSYIRSVLPRAEVAPLLRDAEVYRLNPEYPLSCDVWEFTTALADARRAEDDREKLAALERAAALAERPLLEGLYGNWAEEIQGRMRDRVENLMLQLAAARGRLGDTAAALEAYRRAAEVDPFRESTHVAVIECLVGLGNRRAAVVEYERLKKRLRAELDTDPLPETAAAIRRLLAAETGTDGDEKSSEAAGGQPVRSIPQAGLKPAGRVSW